MRCPICAGAATLKREAGEDRGRPVELYWYEYRFDIAEKYDWMLWHKDGVGAVPVPAMRYTDSKTVIEIHHCEDRGMLVYTLSGPVPIEKRETDAFISFCKDAFWLYETRGRRAGQKDAKPRRPTTSAARNKAKILAAIRELKKEPVYRRDVARAIGVREATLRGWIKEIGEEWDDLIGEALPRSEE